MAGAKMGLGGGLSNLFGSDTSDLMEESLDNGTKKLPLAKIEPNPSAAAFFARCSAAAGVRCAEQMRTSVGISNDFRRSTHFSITLRSLSDPMTTRTFFICYSSYKNK